MPLPNNVGVVPKARFAASHAQVWRPRLFQGFFFMPLIDTAAKQL